MNRISVISLFFIGSACLQIAQSDTLVEARSTLVSVTHKPSDDTIILHHTGIQNFQECLAECNRHENCSTIVLREGAGCTLYSSSRLTEPLAEGEEAATVNARDMMYHPDTRPTCTELGSASAVALYDSTTAGMALNWLRGISISSITGSVALADWGSSKIHVMDAELNAQNVINLIDPADTTYDDKGFLYVTSNSGHKVHVYDSIGNEISSFGSHGTGYGQFKSPWGITHKAGVLPELYVCDQVNYRVQVFHSNGTFIAAFGASHFDSPPRYIAVDTNIYVSGGFVSGAFYIFTSAYTLINTFSAYQSPLYSVRGIALYNGCLIVADGDSDTIKVFDDNYTLVATIGSSGSSVGQLDNPLGIAATPLGAIYVAEYGNNRVQLFKVP